MKCPLSSCDLGLLFMQRNDKTALQRILTVDLGAPATVGHWQVQLVAEQKLLLSKIYSLKQPLSL